MVLEQGPRPVKQEQCHHQPMKQTLSPALKALQPIKCSSKHQRDLFYMLDMGTWKNVLPLRASPTRIMGWYLAMQFSLPKMSHPYSESTSSTQGYGSITRYRVTRITKFGPERAPRG